MYISVRCSPGPCGDHGTCGIVADAVTCTCVDGWDGTLCENDSKFPFSFGYRNILLPSLLNCYEINVKWN